MKNEGQKTILLVEDEALIAMNEAQIIEKYGYKVIIANSGEKAIKTVEKTPDIDLILMDINLGSGIDGTEGAEKILDKHDIPLIFFSSHTEPEVVEKTEGITSYGYIVKNSGETVLIASIKMAFKLFEAKIKEKAKEEALRESEEKIRAILNASPDVIHLLDINGIILSSNEGFAKRVGLEIDDIVGKCVFDYSHKESIPGRKEAIDKIFRTGEPLQLEDKGLVGVYESNLHPVFNSEGEVKAVAVYARDITKYKQAEKALRESEEKYSSLFKNNHSVMLLIDPQTGNIVDANPSACVFYGYSRAEMTQKKIQEINLLPGEEVQQEMNRAKLEQRKHFLFRHRLSGGKIRDVEVYSGPITVQGKSLLYSIIHDITERKQAENALEKALRKNKTLLSELQHRAKNSFAMIYSMINLTAYASSSDKEKSVLNEIGSRIKAVSGMYDLLYSTGSVSEVRLDEYFNKIVSAIPGISGGSITLKNEYAAVTVPVETAIPVGIIITELITNSIKHAFHGNRNGTINLLLKKKQAEVVIEVKDNGKGLPNGFDISKVTSLGLKLVRILIDQIDGSFKIEGREGTCCVIEFPIEENTSD